MDRKDERCSPEAIAADDLDADAVNDRNRRKRNALKYAQCFVSSRTDDDEAGDGFGPDFSKALKVSAQAQNGKVIAIGFSDGQVQLFEKKSGALVQICCARAASGESDEGDGRSRAVTSISFDRTGTYMCASARDGFVKVRRVVEDASSTAVGGGEGEDGGGEESDDDDDEGDEGNDSDKAKTPTKSVGIRNTNTNTNSIRIEDDVDEENLVVRHKSGVNCCVIDPNPE